jgi:deoxyribonuclease-4
VIGSNVPTIGGLLTAFTYAKDWGCECFQTYLTASRRWNVSALSEKQIHEFRLASRQSSVQGILAHVPFLVNLASPDRELWRKSVNRLTAELSRANQLGVSLLVLHPGSHVYSDRKAGLVSLIDGLNTALQEVAHSSCTVLLETMAGQGTTIGSSFEEIAYVLQETSYPQLLGVCFDTCHVYAAGYDLRGYRAYERIMGQFDRIIGLDKLGAFHLNDSRGELGSRVDRHASIGSGHLGLQVFHAILRDARFSHLPMVLEIPQLVAKSRTNLELLRRLRATPASMPQEERFSQLSWWRSQI